MNKMLLFVCVFFISVLANGQSITKNEVNGFTDERNIETSIVSLKSGFSTGFGIQYRAVNQVYYISFVGYGKSNTTITEDDRIQLILDNGKMMQLNSRVQLPANGSNVPNIFIHHYYVYQKYIEELKSAPLAIVRVVSPAGVRDYKVRRKAARQFTKLSELFLAAVNK